MLALYKSVRQDVEILESVSLKLCCDQTHSQFYTSVCPYIHTKTMNFSKGESLKTEIQCGLAGKKNVQTLPSQLLMHDSALHSATIEIEIKHSNMVLSQTMTMKNSLWTEYVVSYIRAVKRRQFSWVDHARMSHRFHIL